MPKLSLAKLERSPYLQGKLDAASETFGRVPGTSLYDPTCRSGGMLIISREHIEQSGGAPTNLCLPADVLPSANEGGG